MNLRKTALSAGLAAALIVGGTAASMAVEAFATSSVNVRSGPGTGYGVVDQLYSGESVDVGNCSGGWCRIAHSGPDGWVSASYLERDRRGNDDFFDDRDVDVDFFIGTPHRPHYRPYYRPHYRSYDYSRSSVCFGGNNARFCVSD